MPFDGNGNWTSNYNAEADRDANIKILASRFDNILLADLAQSFQNCLTKDTQVKPQQAFNANNYRVINVADPTSEKDAVNKQTMDSTISSEISSSISTLLSTLYPVGSIYIGTQNTCHLATLISGSTWQLVATDKALWGGNGSNANTTIAAGLPNVSGNLGGVDRVGSGQSGPFYTDGTNPKGSGGTTSNSLENIKFSLSKANSIYGKSSTVQPPAYRVNVWRRTA